MHPSRRIEIRNRLVELYKQYIDVGERVFPSRPNPLFFDELPAVLVYFSREQVDTPDSEPRYFIRRLEVNTDIIYFGNPTAVDDFLDSRAYEAEAAINADRYLGLSEWFRESRLLSTIPVEIQREGDQNIASIRLVHEFTYETETFSGVTIDEFLRFNAKYKNENGIQIAEDNVTIRSA